MTKRIFADFNDLSDYPEVHIVQGIPLGLEADVPELRSLQEHEEVILDMPGEIQAEGYVTRLELPQGIYWYGVVTGRVVYADEVDKSRSPSVSS